MNASSTVATVLTIGAALTIAATARAAPAAGDFDLSWRTMDAGGGTSTAGDFTLDGTIGQADAGPAMSAGDFMLVGGFWFGAGAVDPPCPADVDGNRVIDFADLLEVLASWGPYDPCPPFVGADVDRNCAVDFADLLAVLAAWGACP